MRPDWVIPAVSAVQPGRTGWLPPWPARRGQTWWTINLTPNDVRGDYVIYKRDRFIMTGGARASRD